MLKFNQRPTRRMLAFTALIVGLVGVVSLTPWSVTAQTAAARQSSIGVGPMVTGKVLTPDGRPVKDATVYCVTAQRICHHTIWYGDNNIVDQQQRRVKILERLLVDSITVASAAERLKRLLPNLRVFDVKSQNRAGEV